MNSTDLLATLTTEGWVASSPALARLHPGELGIHDGEQLLPTFTRGDADGARHAVVMPVHNQGAHIRAVLTDLQASLALPHELCLVVDDCSDDTLEEVVSWLRQAERGLTTRTTLVVPQQPLFETMCDVVGFASTSAPFVIEVQADMFLRDRGFDERLLSWFEVESSLLAVSGRGGHDLERRAKPVRVLKRLAGIVRDAIPGAYSPTILEYWLSAEIGRTGPRITRSASLKRSDRLYLHETVIRGPLALRRSRYDLLGGLDPSRFFLGDDDHDLCSRARGQGGLVGYTPVRFESPLDAGSTRAERTAQQKALFARFSSYYRALGEDAPVGRGRRRSSARRIVRATR